MVYIEGYSLKWSNLYSFIYLLTLPLTDHKLLNQRILLYQDMTCYH